MAMLSAILKAPFSRSLFLNSVSRYAKPAARASRPLFLEARRTFLTTASVLEEGEATKEKKPRKAKELGESKVEKKPKEPKVKKASVKKPKVKKPKIKVVRYFKKDLKLPIHRPPTPWMDFYQKYVTEHMQPGERFVQYAAGASVAWKAMSAEEKEKYGAPVAEQAEYWRQAKEYRSTNKTYKKTLRKFRKRTARDAPLHPYIEFSHEKYGTTSGLSFAERGIELGRQWRALSPEEKEVYRQRALNNYEKKKAAEAVAENVN